MQYPRMNVIYAIHMLSVMKAEMDRMNGVPDVYPLHYIQRKANLKSLHLLGQVARVLRINGVIRAHKGPIGGYILAKDLDTVTISDLDNEKMGTLKDYPDSLLMDSLNECLSESINKYYHTPITSLEGFGVMAMDLE